MRFDNPAAGESTICLEGEFDGIASRQLEALLARAEPGIRFLIDFTQVRVFHDFGLAVLANALTHSRADVAMRGLRQHQIRLLRYFGVETPPLGSSVLFDAA